MDGRLLLGHGAGRRRPGDLELCTAPDARPPLHLQRCGPVLALVSGRLPGLLLDGGLRAVRGRYGAGQHVEVHGLHLAGDADRHCRVPPPLPAWDAGGRAGRLLSAQLARCQRTAGPCPAGQCPHPVDRGRQPRCAHPAGPHSGLGGAAGAGRSPAHPGTAEGRRHPHSERTAAHPH